jgi:CRISPR-associated protein Csm2
MNRGSNKPGFNKPSGQDLKTIITDPNGAETMVKMADGLGRHLKDQGLSTAQIRALFGEVRQIEGEWSIADRREHARRRLVLLKPKMAYRARRERGRAVQELVSVLDPALDLVVKAQPRPENQAPGAADNQDDNFQRFVEFFEAILAYHKAYGGN